MSEPVDPVDVTDGVHAVVHGPDGAVKFEHGHAHDVEAARVEEEPDEGSVDPT